MEMIQVEHHPNEEKLKKLNVFNWPIWTKEISEFSWSYDTPETCYFLEGDVVVTPDGGKPVRIGKGHLVIFRAGLCCTWKIKKDVKKHYRFG